MTKKGAILFHRRKPLYGIGINDSDYPVEIKELLSYSNGKQTYKTIWKCPFMQKWRSMLQRCYSESHLVRQPTYKGCSVCEEWLTFSNFKSWFIENHVDGYNLDKDLKIVGNKVYSSDTCLFVPVWLNCFLSDCRSSRGVLPIGVVKDHNTFRARCNNPKTKRREHLGNFKSEQQAYEAWLLKKLEFAFELKTEMDIIHKDIYPNIVKMIKDKV